jgi:hypothetical protein
MVRTAGVLAWRPAGAADREKPLASRPSPAAESSNDRTRRVRYLEVGSLAIETSRTLQALARLAKAK